MVSMAALELVTTDQGCGGTEIFDYGISMDTDNSSALCAKQDSRSSGCSAGQYVGVSVTHNDRTRQIEAVLAGRTLKHADIRLATGTDRLRMRAEVSSVQPSAFTRKQCSRRAWISMYKLGFADSSDNQR